MDEESLAAAIQETKSRSVSVSQVSRQSNNADDADDGDDASSVMDPDSISQFETLSVSPETQFEDFQLKIDPVGTWHAEIQSYRMSLFATLVACDSVVRHAARVRHHLQDDHSVRAPCTYGTVMGLDDDFHVV